LRVMECMCPVESANSRRPPARPRLVAIDVDDTLLEADLTLLAECADAISRARATGVRVVLATGRMFSSVRPYAERLGLDGYMITYNGGLIQSLQGERLWHRPVPRESAIRLVDEARRVGFCLNLYLDDRLIVETDDDERVQYYVSIAGVDAVPVGDLKAALQHGEPTKCLFVGDADRRDAVIAELQASFPELKITGSKPRFIEVTHREIHKEVALAAVAEAYGIAMDAVMAVGDADNDATMLARAGWGVAVANASPGARRAADIVTEGARGRGVAEAFDRFVLA